jgi:branched-chain amino acid transport system substrate-binding protein
VIPAGETLKLGIGAPFTGDNAGVSLAFSQAAQIAIEEANASPIEGFTFSQIDQNDEGNAEGGEAAATALAADPTVVAVVGHAFSGASRGAIPIYEAAGIPMMSPTATNPTLTQNGSRVFNRVTFSDTQQGRLMAEYLYTVLNLRKLAIIADESVYSIGLADVATATFTELGGEVVVRVDIQSEQEDYSEALAEVAAAAPDAIFFPGYTPEVAIIVSNLEAADLGGAVFSASDGVNVQDLIELSGDASEGVYTSGDAEAPDSPAKEAFRQAHLAKFGQEPNDVSRSIWSAYDAANILIAAVREVAFLGEDGKLYVPRTALVDRVRATSDYQGTSGLIDCDATGECNTVGPDISVIQNGQAVPVPLDALRTE